MTDPKNMPRVPHATADGLQEGRPHPALRRYQASYGVVDWSEGLKLLGERRMGKRPKIEGGVDDGRPEMALEHAAIPDPYSKMRINPKEPVHGHGSGAESLRDRVMSMGPGEVEASVRAGRYDPFTPAKDDVSPPPDAVMPPAPEEAASTAARPKRQRQRRQEAPERQPAAQELGIGTLMAASERLARIPELERELASARADLASARAELDSARAEARKSLDYLSGRARVEMTVNGMTFSVNAVDVIQGASGVVVLLPTSGDSMTFLPPVGADTAIHCQSKGVHADTAFTGTSFEMPVFGLLGLAFLKRPDAAAREAPPRPSLREFVGSLEGGENPVD